MLHLLVYILGEAYMEMDIVHFLWQINVYGGAMYLFEILFYIRPPKVSRQSESYL